MKRALGILTFAVIGWAMTSPAEADTYLRFCTGSGPCTGVADGSNSGTFYSAGNAVGTLFVTLGTFTVQGSVASSDSPGNVGSNTSANGNIQVENSGTAGALTVEYSATNFTQPTGQIKVQAGLGASATGTTAATSVDAQGFVDDSNAAFGFVNPTMPPLSCAGLGAALAADCAGLAASTVFTSVSGLYSISGRTTVTLGAGTAVTTALSVGTTPVPEPGSMMLLGTGLFGLAGVIRRRMTNAVKA